jgi:methyl-accepting chemotaxis protein
MTNLTFASRIRIGYLIMTSIAIAVSCIAYWQIRLVNKALVSISVDSVSKLHAAEQIRYDVLRQLDQLKDAIDEPRRPAIPRLGGEGGSPVETYAKALALLPSGEQPQETGSPRRSYAELYETAVNLIQSDQSARAKEIVKTQLTPQSERLIHALDDMARREKANVDAASAHAGNVAGYGLVLIMSIGLVALGCGFGIPAVIIRNIIDPLEVFVKHLGEIAAGDISQDAPAAFLARGDEIGKLANTKQKMIDNLRRIVKDIAAGVQILSSSSAELLANSTQMTNGSRHASDRAHSVSAAAEEMSSNITSVAAGMEETATNLATVANATDEMTSTIGQIANNSEKARRITAEATKQAARITEQIDQLGQAALEIGKVTETITEISSQTNLLALNATIEAARAGSAGKGFAVVATEIKALAQQTAKATEDIKSRITSVQSATASGVTAVREVSVVIQEVSEIVSAIAVAIEEQSATTQTIARNIVDASTGVRDANLRVSESSLVSREIAKDIVDVDKTAEEMATGSNHVRKSATDLTTVADRLQLAIAAFQQ